MDSFMHQVDPGAVAFPSQAEATGHVQVGLREKLVRKHSIPGLLDSSEIYWVSGKCIQRSIQSSPQAYYLFFYYFKWHFLPHEEKQ